jgi:hypothetical protein
MKACVHLWKYLAEFFLRKKNIWAKRLKNGIAHLCSPFFFFRKLSSLWENVERYGRFRQTADDSIRRMRFALSFIACSALHYFCTLFHKRHYGWGKKRTQIKMCVLIFSTTLFDAFPVLTKLSEISSKIYIGLHVQYPLFCQILMKLNFFGQISGKN